MLFVEADEIVQNLWQGSFPPPGEAVRGSGFSMLVLAAQECQEPALSYPGVEVIHAPNYDDSAHRLIRERLHIALQAAQQVANAVQSGRKVLVTCAAGLNRSGLITGMALHMLYGWNGRACIERVRRKRRTVNGIPPLSNYDFVEALMKLNSQRQVPPGWHLTDTGVLIPV